MPKVTFVKEKRTIEVPEGANLRSEALKNGIQVHPGIHKNWFANCHGLGQCASCCVQITKGDENVSRRYMQGLYGGIPIVSDAEFAAALSDLTSVEAVRSS